MDLRHAMTEAGLTLGQTQVGGNGAGGNQSQGQGAGQGSGRNGFTGNLGGATPTGVTETATSSGVRAYA